MAAERPFPGNGTIASSPRRVERAIEPFNLIGEVGDAQSRFGMTLDPHSPFLLLLPQEIEAVVQLVLGRSQPGALRVGERLRPGRCG